MKKIITTIILVAITTIAFAALNTYEKKLIGTWANSGNEITFNEDRTLSGSGDDETFENEGQWKAKETALEIWFDRDDQSYYFKYKLNWVNDEKLKIRCIAHTVEDEINDCPSTKWYTMKKKN